MESNVQPTELKTLFRENMRARRKELGLTQAALAKRVGVHQPHIAALESGGMAPTLDSIAKVASALHTTPSALLSAGIFSEVA